MEDLVNNIKVIHEYDRDIILDFISNSGNKKDCILLDTPKEDFELYKRVKENQNLVMFETHEYLKQSQMLFRLLALDTECIIVNIKRKINKDLLNNIQLSGHSLLLIDSNRYYEKKDREEETENTKLNFYVAP